MNSLEKLKSINPATKALYLSIIGIWAAELIAKVSSGVFSDVLVSAIKVFCFLLIFGVANYLEKAYRHEKEHNEPILYTKNNQVVEE